MSPASAEKVRVLCCGIFGRELGSIDPGLRDRIEPEFLDSMLHMRPALLDERLGGRLDSGDSSRTLVIYGDCCPHMREFCSGAGRARTYGINCIEISLGSERYRELRRRGAFFLMAEWLGRWKEIFAFELGLSDPELARTFMQDSASSLVYVDTGCVPVPVAALEEVATYLGLPYVVETCGLGNIEKAIAEALERLGDDA